MKRQQRPVPPLTESGLERAALRYLERYAASAAGVRRVLRIRVETWVREQEGDRAQGHAWIEALIERFLASGLLNDAAYAEAKTASLRRRGASARAIHARLAAQGVDAELTSAALTAHVPEGVAVDSSATPDFGSGSDSDSDFGCDSNRDPESAELIAARALARRRRLGPFRTGSDRATHRLRDLGVLGRAGFSAAIARRVVEGELDEEGAEEACGRAT